MTDVVRVHDKGRVRTIALNRPNKMNALTHALAWAIVTEVQKAAHDDDVWVIALTGQGKAFCAGLDLTGPGEGTYASPVEGNGRLGVWSGTVR
jgi:2-(1,2-epoxy-1,2-dihydrophenyl)acetyl-CoA isomerase